MTPDQISAGASVATTLIAIIAVLVARNQIRETRNITRESTATNLYNHCLEMSLQHPMLAEPALSGGFNILVKDANTAACYSWFVASMMLSCEEILAVTRNDVRWRASVSATLDGHAEYFRFRNGGEQPLRDYYSDDLSSLIDEIAANLSNPPEARAIRMSRLNDA